MRTDENGPDDALGRRLHEASRRAGDVGRLPSGAAVRARGDRRRHRRTAATALAALVVLAGVVGGVDALDGADRAPVAPAVTTTTTPPEPPPTDSPQQDLTTAQLTDGTRAVDVRTYAGTLLVPTSEGGFTVTDAPDPVVPTTWVVAPVDGAPDRHSLQASLTREGRPYCLDVPDGATVALAPCDPAAATQRVSLGGADFEGQVTVQFDAGYLTVDGDGQLATSPTNTSPAELFTLEDRGPA